MARDIASPHDKSVHHIALPTPSVHAPHLLDAYNMFATSAIDNLIVLWDIRFCFLALIWNCFYHYALVVRAPRSVARYGGHVNRREPVQAAVSPCLRYLATGSEDKSVRMVDLRTGRELLKLAGLHSDVVSAVAFHPLKAQLASVSYDGTVKFYKDPDGL